MRGAGPRRKLSRPRGEGVRAEESKRGAQAPEGSCRAPEKVTPGRRRAYAGRRPTEVPSAPLFMSVSSGKDRNGHTCPEISKSLQPH